MHVLNSLTAVSVNYIWLEGWSGTDIPIASHSALSSVNSPTQQS
jgi:hypothetical protein